MARDRKDDRLFRSNNTEQTLYRGDRIWTPQLTVLNALSPPRHWNSAVVVHANGTVDLTETVSARVRGRSHYGHVPHKRTFIELAFAPLPYSSRDVVLELEWSFPLHCFTSDRYQEHTIHLASMYLQREREESNYLDRREFSVAWQRLLLFASRRDELLIRLAPAAVLSLVSCAALFLPSYALRIASLLVLAAAMLVTEILQWAIGHGEDIGHLMMIPFWITVLFFYAVAALIESLVVAVRSRCKPTYTPVPSNPGGSNNRSLFDSFDLAFKIFYVLSLAIFNVVFWIRMGTKYNREWQSAWNHKETYEIVNNQH